MMSPAPKGKQPKLDRDGVIQTAGKKEAGSPHNFPTSHLLRTRPSMEHRKPKPFPKEPRSKQMRSSRRPQSSGRRTPMRSGEHTRTKCNGNSTRTLQLGAQGNQRANFAKKVGRDKAAGLSTSYQRGLGTGGSSHRMLIKVGTTACWD